MKKNIVKVITILLVVALPLAFIGCEMTSSGEYAEASYVSVKINPEIELVVDGEGNVEAVYCINEDAELLLVDLELVGMNAEDAIETFVDAATEAGYIDAEAEENEVIVGVVTDEEDGEKGEIKEEIENRVKERINKYFENKGIFGRVSEETLDKYGEEAAELGVSLGKTKMILRALEMDPLLDIEELKEMPMSELARSMAGKAKNAYVDAAQREQFKQDREEILEEYPEIETLKQEIETLKEQLADFDGEEEDREALEDELEQKVEEFETLKNQVKEEVDELVDNYKSEREQVKEQHREEVQKRIENNREKADKARENAGRRKAREIRNWRKNHK